MQIEAGLVELLKDIDEVEHSLAGLQMKLDGVVRVADPAVKHGMLLTKRTLYKTMHKMDKKLIRVTGTLKH
jgi:hypothetical protein